MNKQLIKDVGRLLNDARLGFCDVRSDKTNNGVIIGRVVWSDGGSYFTVARGLHVTYDNLLDTVRAIYASHPTRKMDDVLYCVKYNTKRRTYTFAVTNSSNLELFDVKHRRISAALVDELEYFVHKCDVQYVTAYCDGFVSHADKQGGYTFKL